MRKFSFQQQVLTGFVATLFFVFLLAVVSYVSIENLQENGEALNRTEQIVRLTEEIEQSLVDAETSERGFVITGNPEFLDRYHSTINLVNPGIQKLRDLIGTDPQQVKLLDSLSFYAALKLEEMKRIVAAYDGTSQAASFDLIKTNRGRSYMNKVRSFSSEIERLESQQLVAGKSEGSKAVARTRTIILLGSFVILCLIVVLFAYIKKTFWHQKLIEDRVRSTNAELEKITHENERQNWLLEGAVIVDAAMRGAQTLDERALCIIVEISKHVKANIGVIYIADPSATNLHFKASYGFPPDEAPQLIKPQEGLIGQAIAQRKGLAFDKVPDGYIKVGSGLGQTKPNCIFIQPIFLGEQLKGVIELAFVDQINPSTAEFFNKVVYSIGVAIGAAEARVKMLDLVEKTKQQAEELEAQHSKIQSSNEELLRKTSQLQASEEEMKRQQEELRRANEEMRKISLENERQNWVLVGSNTIGQAIREEHGSSAFSVNSLASRVLSSLASYVNAQVGVIFIADDSGQKLNYAGGYAFQPAPGQSPSYALGEGLIGQAARDGKMVVYNEVLDDHIKVSTGLGEVSARTVIVQPLLALGKLKGVIELGFTSEVSTQVIEFVEWMKEILAVEITTAQAKIYNQELFEKTQLQAEELESQHEELRTTNEELIRKTQLLQASEEELMVQQEELRQTNAELEEKAELLEERNRAIEQAREAMVLKAEELEQSSKYKSEFLANMSHELRTPLNSILILAKILRENKHANLNPEQIKYAGVIHTAGSDLLNLINDILDLSKIESGKIDINAEEVSHADMKSDMELLFHEVANTKKIEFNYSVAPGVPAYMISDRQRVEQIIKNLLSNAFKFTPQNGKVSVSVSLVKEQMDFSNERLKNANNGILAFAVKDSGIGIPLDKQKAIFEAFQQADGTTSRKYGGTGLGLSICRELSNLLGGEIKVQSEPNAGSTFTLYLPLELANQDTLATEEITPLNQEPVTKPAEPVSSPAQKPIVVQVDRSVGVAKLPDPNKEYSLLIVEDDPNFAEILKDYAKERGFKPLHAADGVQGLEMAKERKPDAIVLDIMLPGMDGWTVLKKLKEDPQTYGIPVHLMSAKEETNSKARLEGAIGFLKKPVEKEELDSAFDTLIEGSGKTKIKRVLLVEDQRIQSDVLTNQLKSKGVEVKQAFDGEETMAVLAEDADFDCIILDLKLPDISGLDLLEKIKTNEELVPVPVVINTAMELDQDSMSKVMKHTHAMVLKSNKSNDRLLDEINLFMNKIKTAEIRPATLGGAKSPTGTTTTLEKTLKDKTVLLVDDDMRNIFALSSALQEYDLKIEIANNGIEALKKLEEMPGTDIVLMDIMMPEMDGYETMREIRKQSRFTKLPIIALTAKAMKNDRERTIEAGANDYISKPVDVDKLVSMMRVWLS
ncbi:response regulator [Pedobacter sp. SYSU D00535]|uniref:response regulator n=1 Tax=Pedobacter sp. SYSU D00535 TaxID=2810308 RepID=UPI001A95D4DD|nr:response regulator [Pedobacter sp. SYSU D00535]